MAHPDYIVAPEARADLPLLEPVYPLTAGLSGKVLLKAVRQALERVPDLAEWQEQAWLEQRGWPDFAAALHAPAPAAGCRRRLAGIAAAGSGWPTTSCWPASWRSRWCGESYKSQRGRPITGDGRIRATHRRLRCPSRSPTRSARR